MNLIAEKPAPYKISKSSVYVSAIPKPVPPKPEKKVNLSLIKVAVNFGMETVKEIQGNLIIVLFGETEKKFQFPVHCCKVS